MYFTTSSFNDLHNLHTQHILTQRLFLQWRQGDNIIITHAKWRWTKRKQLNETKYACSRNKLHVISLTSLQHNTSYTMFSWTFPEVYLNVLLTFVQSITQATGKLFVFLMYWMMLFQFSCCIETLWTFTANIRLHSFMSLNVYFELLFAAEFLLTNVTREPSTFIVWLQQMCL